MSARGLFVTPGDVSATVQRCVTKRHRVGRCDRRAHCGHRHDGHRHCIKLLRAGIDRHQGIDGTGWRGATLSTSLWVVAECRRCGQRATGEVWEGARGLEWMLTSPALDHRCETPPEGKCSPREIGTRRLPRVTGRSYFTARCSCWTPSDAVSGAAPAARPVRVRFQPVRARRAGAVAQAADTTPARRVAA